MAFVADDLAAWLVGVLADAGRKRLCARVLGTEQERALRQAAEAAVRFVAGELRPGGGEQAEELALVVSQVFSQPGPDESSWMRATLLESLQAGVAGQLAVLDDPGLTGLGRSSAEVLGVPVGVLAEKLTGHLIREVLVRGARGGPLEPLAAQLNHDVTHLRGARHESMVGQLAALVQDTRTRLDTRLAESPSLPGVRCSLPPESAAFTGRDAELGCITAALADGGGVKIQAIVGMPGVGKTALAVRAAYLLRHQFPDRQLFIDLHGHTPGQEPMQPGAAVARLLEASGADARFLPEDTGSRAALWRDRTASQRLLLVLDNASSSAQVAPLLPGGDGCLVLITSRRHLGDLPGAAAPLMLESLPPSKAREMFLRLAPLATGGPADAVAELTQLAGCLPLAISLLARLYARHPTWAVADLVAEARGRALTLAVETKSVAAAFELSYRQLASSQQEFFRRLSLHPGTTIDAYASAALAGLDLESAVGHLDALHSEGLLTEVGYRRYGMHDLIRRYARDRAAADDPATRQQALSRLLDYYQHAAAISAARIPRHNRAMKPPEAAGMPAAAPAMPDRGSALAWARAENANLLACLDHVTVTAQHARVASLTAEMAAFLRADGPWTDAITRHATAVQGARHLDDQHSLADALCDLGIIRLQVAEYDGAAQVLEEALGIYRTVGDRLGEANALADLGAVQRRTGRNADAAHALEEALSLYCDIGDQLGQAYALKELGTVRRLTGDYANAVQALTTAFGVSGQLGDQRGQANALTYLGVVLRQTGDHAGAADALEEALSIFRLIDDRVGESEALNEAGAAYMARGDLAVAEACHREAYDLACALGIPPTEASALAGLGRCALNAGRTADAEKSLRKAQAIFSRIGSSEADKISVELDAIICARPADGTLDPPTGAESAIQP